MEPLISEEVVGGWWYPEDMQVGVRQVKGGSSVRQKEPWGECTKVHKVMLSESSRFHLVFINAGLSPLPRCVRWMRACCTRRCGRRV